MSAVINTDADWWDVRQDASVRPCTVLAFASVRARERERERHWGEIAFKPERTGFVMDVYKITVYLL